MTNYAIGNFMFTMNSLCDGVTIYNIGKFTRGSYFELLTKYKVKMCKYTVYRDVKKLTKTSANCNLFESQIN